MAMAQRKRRGKHRVKVVDRRGQGVDTRAMRNLPQRDGPPLADTQPSERLRVLRQNVERLKGEKEWSNAELARRAKMSRSGIGHFMKGTRMPLESTVAKIAAALGVAREVLYGEPPLAERSALETLSASWNELSTTPKGLGQLEGWLRGQGWRREPSH